MARIIAISNQKGGVGKTTTAINLSAYLAALGKRVLLVDFDPQANATSGIGATSSTGKTVYHALLGHASPQEAMVASDVPLLHVMRSGKDLAGAPVELIRIPHREYVLERVLNRLRHYYHYIIIDLPPSLNLLTVNGLVAADEVIIPVQCEYYSLEGLSQLLETIQLINHNLGARLDVAGAVLTMYNQRESLSRQVAREVRRHFPHHVFEVEIPRSVSLAEAPSFSKPIILHDPNSWGARAYLRLAREVIAQENQGLVRPDNNMGSITN